MSKNTMMGKLLSRVHTARYMANTEAVDELWKRNKLDNPNKREGYKLAETATIHRDGTEVKEFRLYKLIDATVVTISSEVSTEIKLGVEALRENNKNE